MLLIWWLTFQCPVDMRKCLAENIVVMGGSAMIPGFMHRLLSEIKNLLKEPKYKNKTALKTFKYHKPPAKENYVAWLGGMRTPFYLMWHFLACSTNVFTWHFLISSGNFCCY